MPRSFADFDSEFSGRSGSLKRLSFLPTSKSSRHRDQQSHTAVPAKQSLLSQDLLGQHHHHNRNDSSTSASTSAATSRSSTSTSMSSHGHGHVPFSAREASLKAQEIRPSSDVAEWAHQMHMTQGRSYWWCQGCFPRDIAEPLHIPKAVEKLTTGRRVRINEPSHCYDI